MNASFVIIGAQKSGTTSVAKRLEVDPRICFCKEKEPHFFSFNADWRSKIDEYHNLFHSRNAELYGEASTSYSFIHEYPDVPQNLYSYNKHIKLIYILRDPVQRIISHYSHRLMRGLAHKVPEIEISKNTDYLNRSKYWDTISAYLKHFSKDQILILFFEEYIQNPEVTMQKIYTFLGLPYLKCTSVRAKNKSIGSNRVFYNPIYYLDKALSYSPLFIRKLLSPYVTIKLPRKPVFSDELQLRLWDSLNDNVKLLENFTNIQLDKWRNKYRPAPRS